MISKSFKFMVQRYEYFPQYQLLIPFFCFYLLLSEPSEDMN